MHIPKLKLCRFFPSALTLFGAVVLCSCFSQPAHASTSILDAFNLSPFIPLVLETMMNIAKSLYKYFVGDGTGLVYLFIYAFFIFYIVMYSFKMFLPKGWLEFFGFSDGGEIWENKVTAWSAIENVLKPCMRAIIAGVVLLQIKPVYVTEWLVNPFLEFGAIYTNSILKTVNNSSLDIKDGPVCSASILDQDWISERSCNFLIKPVHIISKENNRVISYGLKFLNRGLRGLMTLMPHGGEDILNVITGILLISAFVTSNLLMALLIIQGIFDFCLALIMYPFKVLTWVATKSDKWFDVLPAFDQIIQSLKKLVITMIACAFILCVNIALVRSLFSWSSSVFVTETGNAISSNAPTMLNSGGNFGQHSMLWLSSVLTFFLMYAVFKMTKEKLEQYSGMSQDLYKDVTSTGKRTWEKIKAAPDVIKTMWGIKNKVTKDK